MNDVDEHYMKPQTKKPIVNTNNTYILKVGTGMELYMMDQKYDWI